MQTHMHHVLGKNVQTLDSGALVPWASLFAIVDWVPQYCVIKTPPPPPGELSLLLPRMCTLSTRLFATASLSLLSRVFAVSSSISDPESVWEPDE
jgi:hypothetical protein